MTLRLSTRVALLLACALLAPSAHAAPGKLLHSERSLYREVLVYETRWQQQIDFLGREVLPVLRG